MNRVKKGWENQAIGIVPLLLFLWLDNYLPYIDAYTISALCCLIALFAIQLWGKEKLYSFMLLPSAATFLLYALFMLTIPAKQIFAVNTPLIVEIFLVVSLIFIRFSKKTILRRARNAHEPAFLRAHSITSLNEFFFVALLFQNLYTLHLFTIILYSIMPEPMQSTRLSDFFYRDLGLIIGLIVIIYEQIRLLMVQGRLKKEMWLPVLNDQGNVIGCIAYSVSRLLPKKYYHPIVRVALVYKGMLYLTQRNAHSCVSASMLDHPFNKYVLFRQSIDQALSECLAPLEGKGEKIHPRLLIRYTFENNTVKHQVSLFVVCIRNEQLLEKFTKEHKGKFWFASQIEENLHTCLFSEYFEKEFSYLKNTILLAENFSCQDEHKEA